MTPEELRFFDPFAHIDHTENRLPHWQQPGAAYFVTFRLADAVPKALLDRWQEERAAWLRQRPEPWTPEMERKYHQRFSGQIEQWLDAGHGSGVLRDPRCARIVGEALAFFESTRCTQLAWVVMPNHVHTLFVLHEPWKLETMVHSWKRHAAREINRLCERTGALWQKDYFDRLIRDPVHLANCVRYVRRNPEKARLRAVEALLWESELAKAIE